MKSRLKGTASEIAIFGNNRHLWANLTLVGLCSIEDYATLSPEAIRKMNTPRKAKIKTKDDIRANLATKPKSLLSNKLGLSVEYLTVFPVRKTWPLKPITIFRH